MAQNDNVKFSSMRYVCVEFCDGSEFGVYQNSPTSEYRISLKPRNYNSEGEMLPPTRAQEIAERVSGRGKTTEEDEAIMNECARLIQKAWTDQLPIKRSPPE